MHRNTLLLVSALAVIAALLLGINIGRRFQSTNGNTTALTPSVPPVPSGSPAAAHVKSYVNAFCKIAFEYPVSLTVFENASGSAAFTGKNADEGILLTCQKDIPRPSFSLDDTEALRIGSVAATLFHTKTASEGATIDSLIFRHPATRLDVFLAGSGEAFRKLISTISIVP
ncbi:hypothetical protein HY949_05410 [Candidatus Gottesmanbacteria bacterium]|nr:hypothetical protein [Candidatus Gottesmanbacteria bacterium]